MTEEQILEAMNNDIEEAKMIVDDAIEKNHRWSLYRMYEVGKVLIHYLHEDLKNEREIAHLTDRWLTKMSDYMKSLEEAENAE